MSNTQRTFIPGDSWVYYKIYTGAKTSDIVLTEIIKPIAEQLIDQNVIDQWFFIRYADPKHHLRVRFHCKDKNNIGKVINALYGELSAFAKADLVWKIQLDTYHRELERYGAQHIELAEQLFYYESQMIVSLLDVIGGEEGEEIRWLFGVRALDKLLSDFKEEDSQYNVLLELLDHKTKQGSDVVNELINSLDKRLLNDYLGSYAHMLMNRLFRSKNRVHEMVVYDLLYRHYRIAWGIRTFKNNVHLKTKLCKG